VIATPTNSFKQFNYSLRPSKQVERKVMIEVLLRLGKAGYSISDYKYLGFGSVYYVDFVMFHKYLFIHKMVCIEWGDVARRMRFNKPFKFIELKLGSLSTHIPAISSREKFLVWLDYDRSLDTEILQDINGTVGRLSPGSIFAITIDARPKLPRDPATEGLSADDREKLTLETYKRWFDSYVDTEITRDTVSSVDAASLFYEVVIERLRKTLARRSGGLRFIQLFNYFYRDGAPMLTIGGVIGTDQDHENIDRAGIFEHRFVKSGADALEISVPPLTLREKYWLDSRLDSKLTVAKIYFELDDELLQNYRTFYKEYPTYLETLL